MPKINVYLSDELAAAVRQAGVPVSPVCQHALSEAVAAVTRARRAAEAIRDPSLTPALAARLSLGVGNRMTDRLRTAISLAGHQAGEAGPGQVSTGGLLLGLLDEGANLALSILQSLDVDLDELRVSAERAQLQEEEVTPSQAGRPATEEDEPPASALQLQELTRPARSAVATAIEAGISLGHNYVGCEHLLLGLLESPAGETSQAGQVLGGLGVSSADIRRALKSAIAGFTYGRKTGGPAPADAVSALAARLETIERRLSAIGG